MKNMTHPADNLFYIDREIADEISMCLVWAKYIREKLNESKSGRINITLRALYDAICSTGFSAQTSLSEILCEKEKITFGMMNKFDIIQRKINFTPSSPYSLHSTKFYTYALKSARNTMDMLLAAARRRGLAK